MAAGHYMAKWRVEWCWVPDGAGPMGVPSAQTLIQNNDFGANGGFVLVPGGSTPTGANFTTAATSIGTNIGTAINLTAPLAQVQGFATGGG